MRSIPNTADSHTMYRKVHDSDGETRTVATEVFTNPHFRTSLSQVQVTALKSRVNGTRPRSRRRSR